MSFGFSVGDFIAVGNLAWTVYRSCKGLTEDFHEVCREALTVHTVIKVLQDEAIDPQSLLNLRGISRKQELILLIKGLEEALEELDDIVRKYQGLAKRERRIWNKLRLATEDLDGIRSKLAFHVTAINAFTSSLSRDSLAQIETVLLDLVNDVQQGRRHPSFASLHETDNHSSVWRELESELAKDGISGAEVAKHKVSIKIFVQGLLSNSNVDTASLVEVASLTESRQDAVNLLPEDLAGLLTEPNAQNGNLASADSEEWQSTDEEYESADEELTTLSPDAFNVPTSDQHSLLNQAYDYLDQLKTHTVYQPVKYNQFLDVLNCFKMKVLDTPGVIEWVCAILVCYPELVQNFNMFLPDGYGIECGMVDNQHAFRVIMPFAAYVRIPDLEAMQSLVTEGKVLHIGLLKWIDSASLNILQRCFRIAADWTTKQSACQAAEAIQARKTFRSRLRVFLARLVAVKDSAADTGRSDEANNVIHDNDRTELARNLKRQ